MRLWIAGIRGCFNSRSREGSDEELITCVSAVTGFNSRSREGSDSIAKGIQAIATFQFTLPRGERPARCASSIIT